MRNINEVVERCKTLVAQGWRPVRVSNLVGFVPPPGRFVGYEYHCDPVTALCCQEKDISPACIEQIHTVEPQDLRPAIAARLLDIPPDIAVEVINLGWSAPEWHPLFG